MSDHPPGTAKATVFIDNDRVMDGKVRLETPTGPAHAEMKKGVPYFRHAGVEHDVINANDTEYAFIEIELK